MNVSPSLASALGVDLALSKTDGLMKLADHVTALLTPAECSPKA
jgi:hypothetical protein